MLQETKFADGLDGVLSALAADGAVIVRDFLSPDLLARLRDELDAVAATRGPGTVADHERTQTFWGVNTTRFTRLPFRSPAALEVVTHPQFLAVADAVLLPNCTNYWMNTAQAIFIGPGEPAQTLHRDGSNWPHVNRWNGPEITVSCMLAIDDFTEDNGATITVPGSHLWEKFETPGDGFATVPAVMPAGSGLLYSGKVLHGGGANQTDAVRRAMHVSYVVSWLTPEEALPLSVPWEVVRDQPEKVQQLFGWRCTSFGVGAGRLWTVDYEDVPVGLDLD